MNLVKNLKKVMVALLTVATIFTCVLAVNTKEADAYYWDKPVEFVGLGSMNVAAYVHVENPYAVVGTEVYIQVENSAYNKDITLWYTDRSNNGEWHSSSKAEYVKSLGNNRELWKVKVWFYGVSTTKFCVHYQSNTGIDVWDNNNGNDYNLADYPANQIDPNTY